MIPRDAIDAERRALADTLTGVGADAPTACGSWTALDLAAHLASLERAAGVMTFIGRSLVARGVRLNDRAGGLADRVITRERRHGFEALVAQLRRPSPWLLLRSSLAPVGLFEVWMHHEDVAIPNAVAHGEREGLGDVLSWLARYQSRALAGSSVRLVAPSGEEWLLGDRHDPRVEVRGALGDLVRWSAGRPPQGMLDFTGDADAVARRLHV